MIEFKNKPMPQNYSLFRELYKRVFGEEAYEGERPSMLAVIKDDGKTVGFMSGYAENTTSFYLQRIGVIGKRAISRKHWHGAAEHAELMGFRYVTGAIRNDNVKALLVALHSGWVIHGFRVDTAGNQYVQVIKDNSHG